jgi:hypothetical protein
MISSTIAPGDVMGLVVAVGEDVGVLVAMGSSLREQLLRVSRRDARIMGINAFFKLIRLLGAIVSGAKCFKRVKFGVFP